jgi:RND family efflux transporter MFP subunit
MPASLKLSPCALAAALALTLAAGCKPAAVKAPEKKPPEVFVSLPSKDAVTEFEEFTGYIAAKQMIEIRARVSGYLDDVKFVEGAKVNKDDLLFEIDDRVYKANALNAAALVNEAKAKRDGLISQYKRAQDLLKRDAISAEDAEILQYQLAEAEAAVSAAEAKKEMADLDVTYTKIKAPIAGVISNRRIDPGNLAKADETILGMIVSQHPIYAYFDVNERTVLRLRRLIQEGRITSAVDAKLEVMASLTDEDDFKHKGYIDFMDNQLDMATGTLRVRAVMDNQDGFLSPGLFVRLRFPVGAAQEALMVKEESLDFDQGERFLYVVDDKDVVQYRRVKVGVLRNGKRQIREGLTSSDRVIVTGLQRVKPGDKVAAKPYKEEAVASNSSAPQGEDAAKSNSSAIETKPVSNATNSDIPKS